MAALGPNTLGGMPAMPNSFMPPFAFPGQTAYPYAQTYAGAQGLLPGAFPMMPGMFPGAGFPGMMPNMQAQATQV